MSGQATIKKTTDLMRVYKPCVLMLKDMKALVELDICDLDEIVLIRVHAFRTSICKIT